MKQLRADLANANLARDKMRREVEDANKILTEKKEEMDNIAKVGPPVLNKKKGLASGGGLPLYPEIFTVLHSEPAAPQDHCGRCRI